jgi:Holliday junction resolvasome RuvABC DNA-binding subunit
MNSNQMVARRLAEVADLLEIQHAISGRVNAYRRASTTVSQLHEPLADLYQREGTSGLCQLPGIGYNLAIAIRTLLIHGRLPLLEHLRGTTSVEDLLRSVPGIGPVQAERLHHELHIDTLEELEAAAHDGRLGTVAGFGPKRIAGIIDSLATRLGRVRATGPVPVETDSSVAELLDVDREYRQAAQEDKLHKIAPRRFNPEHEAWLPILHTHRGDHAYTAMYSNTALAHKLNRTTDWVILYHDGDRGACQHTVVTAWTGPLNGLRVVRGREPECLDHYGLRDLTLGDSAKAR